MTDLKQIHFEQNKELEYEFLKNTDYISKYCTAIFLDEEEICEKKDIKDLSVEELKTICANIMRDLRADWSCDYEDRIIDLLDYLEKLEEKDKINSHKYTPYIATCNEELTGQYHDGRAFRDTAYREWGKERLYVYGGKLTLQSLYHLQNIITYHTNEVLLFMPKLTLNNIEKINKIVKVLKGTVSWIGVFTHHCECDKIKNVDKIITTNANGLLKPQETEGLTVIDYEKIIDYKQNDKFKKQIITYYDEAKTKIEKICFEDKQGFKQGIYKLYYTDKTLKCKANYKDGELHGARKWYFEKGTLQREENYKNGKLHGVCKYYDEKEILRCEANYKDGKSHGVCKWYDQEGAFWYEDNYKDGIKITNK